MIIQHNIMALNAHRQLGGNNSLVSKNLEKLSSGFKINRAGDDAAGLAISEKMRAQITGLTRAQANAQDGISLVQTAEGALTEVHSMLNRMVDLATQSANGTIKDSDRTKIQDEMDALTEEITRISKATKFNDIALLDGTMGGGAAGGAATALTPTGTVNGGNIAAITTAATGNAFKSTALTQTGTAGNKDVTFTVAYTDADGAAQTKDVTFKNGTSAADTATAFKTAIAADADLKDLFAATGDNTGLILTSKATGAANEAAVTGITVKTASADAEVLAAGAGTPTAGKDASYDLSGWKANDTITVDGKEYKQADHNTFAALKTALEADGITVGGGAAATTSFSKAAAGGAGGGLTLQIGDTADAHNIVSVSVADMSAKGLGVEGIVVGQQGVSTAAIKSIKDAIETVSSNRSALGAMQNRLEHTINNLAVTTENMTAAESRIRDVDMAKEMMQFTKNNVLSQAAQAMLAQANQQPQQVLQLLR